MFRLRIDPNAKWFVCLFVWPTYKDFAQALMVMEKVGSIAKAVPFKEG
jgi:hypothetical protein